MSDSAARTGALRLRTGDMLPELRLQHPATGAPQRVPALSRNALVLLLLPEGGADFADYVERLAAAAQNITEWYAEIVATGVAAPAVQDGISVLHDPDGVLRGRLGVPAGAAALVIADRYGQIYHTAVAAPGEELTAAGEVESWTRFLATQCPECGVIDEPGHGEWSAA